MFCLAFVVNDVSFWVVLFWFYLSFWLKHQISFGSSNELSCNYSYIAHNNNHNPILQKKKQLGWLLQ